MAHGLELTRPLAVEQLAAAGTVAINASDLSRLLCLLGIVPAVLARQRCGIVLEFQPVVVQRVFLAVETQRCVSVASFFVCRVSNGSLSFRAVQAGTSKA